MSLLLKAVGMAAVAGCCAGAGFELAHTLSARVNELELAIAAISALESEFSYSMMPPDQAVERLAKRPTFAQAGYLRGCAAQCAQGIPFPEAWRQAIVQERGALSTEDAALVASLCEFLGQSDLETQLAGLVHTREMLGVQLLQARERVKTHAGLYRTLGTLCGVFLIILWM